MNNATVKEQTTSVLNTLKRKGLSDQTTVVLIGSCARGVANNRSDIDLLIVHKDEQEIRAEQLGDIHLQQYNRIKFLSRLSKGDDYPSWALRFGRPLLDPDGWWAKQVAMESKSPHWPDWRPKIAHAKKRLNMATELIEVGDMEAASEELMFAASHVARATLIKYGVFPLSRPELPSQLEDVEPELAQVLSKLIWENMDAAHMMRIRSFLKRQVESLSRKSEEEYYPRTADAISVLR